MQSQSIRPFDLVKEAKTKKLIKNVNVLSLTGRNVQKIPNDIDEYQLFSLDQNGIRNILNDAAPAITFNIAKSERESLVLQLVEVELPLFTVKTSSGKLVKYQGGKHYRGIVKGDDRSFAAISIFDNEVMGLISESTTQGNWVLGKLSDAQEHIFYNDPQVQDKFSLECATEDSYEPYDRSMLLEQNGVRALTDCVGMYFEVDNDIYQDKGSNTTSVTNYITGLYNQVAILYANENINTNISEIVIWDVASPYSSSSSSGMLNQFTAYRQGFNGDIAMLLSYQASGGIAYVNGLCSTNPDYRMSFSSIASSYQNVPTYSWSVMVVTHEFGHLLGSSHTHACVWNGNNTAIDGCYTTEGGCSNPGVPSGGGTVMSYCHLTSAGINLNLGFGPQPGNVIRNSVINASCLSTCGGGGNPPAGCTDNEAVLTLVLDNYPAETTWNIKDSGGATLYSGGPYSTAGVTINIDVCAPDGCYDFNIFDSYGDGICCAYGQGSYEIVFNSSVLASGGQFTFSETKNFCLSGGGTPPTCTDGIQNGDETGVDCGGTTCPACPTCTDGIQNGDETGVDCGGTNCPACPTCTDGIQNGDETGVDCGGTACPACPTCNDGIQNGDETGVDCGGTNCPACPTCNDGIQNGDETGVDCGGTICPPCTSCNDGIQNGDETGVDCGGTNCPACPTCTDGIQNGDETGVDCGGTTCPPCNGGCTGTEVTVEIILDNYPGETTWDLKSAGGTVIASGGPYNGQNGVTISLTECLAGGCYDFSIYDSYGDGICCAYGQGSYSVFSSSSTYASGGNFASSEVTNFCLGSPPTPTCTDGIQNGDETGVDCGGTTCPACPTCTDGVQNGDETGVDCGGTTCPPCTSCNDGIQNGDETGVDCGGTTCPPCTSCNDGIQNGDETGVDCGGTTCPACPTCNDGVQNGDETGVDCGGTTCPPCGGGNAVTLAAHYFETGWDNWVDGGSDCYRNNSATYAYEGTYSIRIRDNSGTNSSMTSETFDLTPYASVNFEFYFYPYSMETGEDFSLLYYDGSSWVTVANYVSGTDFNNYNFYVSNLTLSATNYDFHSSGQFRLQCDASTNSDRIYIDAITIEGITGSALPEDSYKTKALDAGVRHSRSKDLVNIRPNPASNFVLIEIFDEEEVIGEIQSLDIYDLMGRNVKSLRSLKNIENLRVDVSNLNNGTYIMRLNTNGEDILTQKFQIIRQ
jgi:hypothetical protein